MSKPVSKLRAADLDTHYLPYACGQLSTIEPQAALELALANLQALDEEISHERAHCA